MSWQQRWPRRHGVSCEGDTGMPTEAEARVLTEDWLIAVYVAVDTWWQRAGRRQVPPRPGPAPACSDAELVALAVAGGVLEGRRARGWRGGGGGGAGPPVSPPPPPA